MNDGYKPEQVKPFKITVAISKDFSFNDILSCFN